MFHNLLLLVEEGASRLARTLESQLDIAGTYTVRKTAVDGFQAVDAPCDGVVLVASDVSRWLSGKLSHVVDQAAPLTVVVAGTHVDQYMAEVLMAGADDAFDPNNLATPSLHRLLQRSIARRYQRVHVSTARKQYEELYANMPVAALTVDDSGNVTRANRALMGLLGVKSESDVTDEFLNGLLSGLAQLQRTMGKETPEYRDRHIITVPSGDTLHVAVFARTHATDGVHAMDVYLTDITELELQARRAMEAENYRREIYDSSPVMMISLDVRTRIIDTNRIFLRTLGLASDDVVGQTILKFLGEGTDRTEFARNAARIQRGEVIREFPVTLRIADGRELECAYSASPHIDANGMVVGMIAMLVDVSERNKAQRERDELHAQLQLTQKLESIGELAAGIAHEINTPAQYVSDNLSFLQESFSDFESVLDAMAHLLTVVVDKGESGSAADALTSAIETADLEYLREEIPSALDQGKAGISKIREIVLALKDFSHPGSGNPEPTDINRLVESTVTVARNEYKYVADVELVLDGSLPAVSCLASAVAQVVLNIVVNAAHAIGEQSDREGRGKISVTTRPLDEANVEIQISDDGPGVPESIRNKIFDPFFTTKEVGRGTGQGLAISRRVITEQHAGQLLLESEAGKGATFRIVLPIKSGKGDGALEAVA
ncbi:MAG: PAS domain S-box protein [Pseudomonadota bacterium]